MSNAADLVIRRLVCGVESICISVESGKLKSPVQKTVQMCGGGRCFLMVRSMLCIRGVVQWGGRCMFTIAKNGWMWKRML